MTRCDTGRRTANALPRVEERLITNPGIDVEVRGLTVYVDDRPTRCTQCDRDRAELVLFVS